MIFKDLIGRTVEVYVDDIIIKSLNQNNYHEYLREILQILRKVGLKLNPFQRVVELNLGKFLGYKVSNRGLEANPDKVCAIVDMTPPCNIKEVKILMGC